jgi:hypothetical protein
MWSYPSVVVVASVVVVLALALFSSCDARAAGVRLSKPISRNSLGAKRVIMAKLRSPVRREPCLTRSPAWSSADPAFRDLQCSLKPPVGFDPPSVLHRLYNSQFSTSDMTGSGGIIVLGQHNSGTSMVTRLVMLLGAFAGNYRSIQISSRNKLKYYEQTKVFQFHDEILKPLVNPNFQAYHAQAFNLSSMTQTQKDAFNVRLPS